jgi:Tfp pilus assembly protein PilN
VAFAGAGTIVQKLHMPPLSPRNRDRAIRTRLTNYAAGRALVIATRLEERPTRDAGAQVLTAGVDCALTRGIHRAGRRAGLHMQSMTALADVFTSPTPTGTAIQLVLGERTTTIQLFDTGRLTSCRDVLLGRRDFVMAYQRPILTATGPLTLTAVEAETLACEVGVPVGREDEVRPGIPAVQLWPLLNPVLQKLRREVEQTLSGAKLSGAPNIGLSVLGAPALPGLAEFLADGLQLRPVPGASLPATYLAALSDPGRHIQALDLRPPEEQWLQRFSRPALAAGLCALLVILANSAVPREASAQLAGLLPLDQQMQAQLAQAQSDQAALEQTRDELRAKMGSYTKLTGVLPPRVPVVELLKEVLGSLPQHTGLVDVRVQADTVPLTINLHAEYQGEVAASVVAARWARALSDSESFSSAKVLGVSGSGRDAPALLELQAVHE